MTYATVLLLLLQLLLLPALVLCASSFYTATPSSSCLLSDTSLTCTEQYSVQVINSINITTLDGTPLASLPALISLPSQALPSDSVQLQVISSAAVSVPPALVLHSGWYGSVSMDVVCSVWSDHSLSCTCPLYVSYWEVAINTSFPLLSWCPYAASTGFAYLSAGRVSGATAGYIGGPLASSPILSSLVGADAPTVDALLPTVAPGHSDTATGYSSVHVTASGSMCVLSYPQRHLSCNGNSSSVNWNQPGYVAATLMSCLPPAILTTSDAAMLAQPFAVNWQLVTLSATALQSTAFDSMCLADSQLCALLSGSGQVQCWASVASSGGSASAAAGAVPWSPPPYLTFSSLTCGATYACGVLSVPSLAGRALCWSTNTESAYSLGQTAMWQQAAMTVPTQAESGVQQTLYAAWQQDQSATGATACATWLASAPPASQATVYDATLAPAPTVASGSSLLLVAASSQGDGDTCALTADGDIVCWAAGFATSALIPPPSAVAMGALLQGRSGVLFHAIAFGGPTQACAVGTSTGDGDAFGPHTYFGYDGYSSPTYATRVHCLYQGSEYASSSSASSNPAPDSLYNGNTQLSPTAQYTSLFTSRTFGCGTTVAGLIECWGESVDAEVIGWKYGSLTIGAGSPMSGSDQTWNYLSPCLTCRFYYMDDVNGGYWSTGDQFQAPAPGLDTPASAPFISWPNVDDAYWPSYICDNYTVCDAYLKTHNISYYGWYLGSVYTPLQWDYYDSTGQILPLQPYTVSFYLFTSTADVAALDSNWIGAGSNLLSYSCSWHNDTYCVYSPWQQPSGYFVDMRVASYMYNLGTTSYDQTPSFVNWACGIQITSWLPDCASCSSALDDAAACSPCTSDDFTASEQNTTAAVQCWGSYAYASDSWNDQTESQFAEQFFSYALQEYGIASVQPSVDAAMRHQALALGQNISCVIGQLPVSAAAPNGQPGVYCWPSTFELTEESWEAGYQPTWTGTGAVTPQLYGEFVQLVGHGDTFCALSVSGTISCFSSSYPATVLPDFGGSTYSYIGQVSAHTAHCLAALSRRMYNCLC